MEEKTHNLILAKESGQGSGTWEINSSMTYGHKHV